MRNSNQSASKRKGGSYDHTAWVSLEAERGGYTYSGGGGGGTGHSPHWGLLEGASGELKEKPSGSETISGTHQDERFWLNEEAPLNMSFISVTWLVFQ